MISKPKFSLKELSKQRGVTSLLVVVALSLIFIVMVSGLTIIAIREQQQASTTDLSNRALQAAQSAIRDAAQKLVDAPNEEYPNCDGTGASNLPLGTNIDNLIRPPLDLGSNITIVCRTVARTTEVVKAPIGQDSSLQINAFQPAGANPTKLDIQWDISTVKAPAAYNPRPPFQNKQFYIPSDAYNFAAALELTIVYWPRVDNNGTVPSLSQVKTVSTLVLPDQFDKSTLRPRFSAANPDYIIGSICDNGVTSPYRCSLKSSDGEKLNLSRVIGADAATYNIILKIEPRYANTDVMVQFFTDSGGKVKVQSDQATIDVTAQAGNVYRRLTATKPIGNSAAIDSVLLTNGKICKNLAVDDNNDSIGTNNCGGSE